MANGPLWIRLTEIMNKSMKPKISFVIPMYNVAAYIETCIDSIIAQNLREDDYEIIAVDDGSKDGVRNIISKKYPSVKYFHKENGGQSTARNMGIEKSSGEYICFVDADDFLIENSIGDVLDMVERNNTDMACYGCGRLKEKKPTETFKEYDILSGAEYIAKNNYNNGPWWYLIKKEFICKNNLRFVEGRYGEDGMFTTEALLLAEKVQGCNRLCYCYVEQLNSTTTNRNRNHLLKVMDDYLFVFGYLRDLAEEYKGRIPVAAYERVRYRAESYLFFLLVRLLRFPNAGGLINEIVNQMKEQGSYPIRRPEPSCYQGLKYPAITYVVNHPWMLKACNKILSLLKTIKIIK